MPEKEEKKPLIPSYESEIKACDDIFGGIIRYINKQRGYVVDIPLLKKAYEKAKELHGDARRHSGVLYLRHPLAVMETLSRLLCKTSILAAALLHDTMEDCDYTAEELRQEFSAEIEEIVFAVTEIKKVEKEAEANFEHLTPQEKHDYLDKLTDAKLIKSRFQREAFLVRLADREHNLSTIDACTPAKRRIKIQQTETFLIPAARFFGMHYFEVTLNDYCLKFKDDNFESEAIRSQRNDLISVSGQILSSFDSLFQRGIDSQSYFSFPAYNPFARLRGGKRDGQDYLSFEKRRILTPYEIKCQLNGNLAFSRGEVYLSEILLLSPDNDKAAVLSNFISFYKKFLQPAHFFFEYDGDNDSSIVIKVSDMYDNNYKVVIIPEDKQEEFFIGNSNGEALTLVSDESISDSLRPQMTVYAYSPYKGLRKFEKSVPKGATALDFAFIVSEAMALTASNAQIKKWTGTKVSFSSSDYAYPLTTILNEGDVVHFVTDYSPYVKNAPVKAKIDWFGYVNTEHATTCLIRYFKSVMPNVSAQ